MKYGINVNKANSWVFLLRSLAFSRRPWSAREPNEQDSTMDRRIIVPSTFGLDY